MGRTCRANEGRKRALRTATAIDTQTHCRCDGDLFPGHERQMLNYSHTLRPGYAVHGFRSSFADRAAERGYPQELREMALAHSFGDAVEQAYRRSTRVNSRREMMNAWSDFALEHRLSVVVRLALTTELPWGSGL